MRIALVHYHFDRGGVTRVAELAAKAMAEHYPDLQIAWLSGRPFGEFSPKRSKVIPRLNYSGPEDRPMGACLADELIESAHALFNGHAADVFHWHNPALGKNVHTIGAIHALIKKGIPVLLHHHDFAEDFRPQNFSCRESALAPNESPYPFGTRVQHAFINQRDQAILAGAGLPAALSHQLPNPVDMPVAEEDPGPAPLTRPYKLYPVRASRRKNPGEFLLRAQLAQKAGKDELHLTTLGPSNPNYRATFNHWGNLAKTLCLPVKLAVNEESPAPFPVWMQNAAVVVTTSVAEGFGLTFFEPALYGKAVEGRDLPEITNQFRALGFEWTGLKPEFPVSTGLFDHTAWQMRLCAEFERTYRSFGRKIDIDPIQRTLGLWTAGGTVDFSRLDEAAQTEVILAINRGGGPLPELNIEQTQANDQHLALIKKHFSPASHAEQLVTIYRRLCNSDNTNRGQVGAQAVLDGFLNPKRFSPLRT